MWMFAQPIHLQPNRPIDLVIGGKNYQKDQSAWLGLLVAPATNRHDAAAWTWKPLARVSWTMSIEVLDLNGDGYDDILFSDKHGPATDGYDDILFSDKHGPATGVWWLENPANNSPQTSEWKLHALTKPGWEGCNFLAVGDLDGDGLQDVIALVDGQKQPGAPDNAHRRILFIRRLDKTGLNWETHEILVPPTLRNPKPSRLEMSMATATMIWS